MSSAALQVPTASSQMIYAQRAFDQLSVATRDDRDLDMLMQWALEGEATWFPSIGYRGRAAGGHHWESLPHWTRDLPTLLRIVPKHWEWNISNRAPAPHAGRAYIHNLQLQFAGVAGMAPNPNYRGFEFTAHTVPLALCLCITAGIASGALHVSVGMQRS